MKICILNGSPKGNYSITLQTARYLAKKFPEDTFETVHVGQKLKALERDFSEAKAAIEKSELLLFVYPVYTFIAPYQMHRFIELLKEAGLALSEKYAAQLSTSKHFYDVTAQTYIKENCADLGLRYVGGLSADMDDLTTEKGQKEALDFWNYVHFCVKKDIFEPISTVVSEKRNYASSLSAVPKRDGFDTVIVTNAEKDDVSLAAMIEDFRAVYPYQTRVINIADYPFAGGCLGCFNCAGDGVCIYKDGFDRFLREKIQTASAIVYAFTIRDHSMGASFKRYDDRQFCNGHRTVTMGMPMGYLVNGELSREANLRMIIEGRCDVGHNFLAGCASDAKGIEALAEKLSYALEHQYVPPQTFYGIGGLKIFRDLIYLMRGMMKADHKFYKKHGFYDFPQKKQGTVLKMKLVGGLITNPKIKAKLGNRMNEGMLAPYQKVLDAAENEKA